MPWSLPVVSFDPPLRAKLAVGDHRARIPQGFFTVDIGALEEVDIDSLIGPFVLPGSAPRVRPRTPTATEPGGLKAKRRCGLACTRLSGSKR
jgi:hypothetical protein